MLKVSNIVTFDFIEPPSPETMSRALEVLVYMKAIDPVKGELTTIG